MNSKFLSEKMSGQKRFRGEVDQNNRMKARMISNGIVGLDQSTILYIFFDSTPSPPPFPPKREQNKNREIKFLNFDNKKKRGERFVNASITD